MIARHITFSGRVQGVGFRFTARRAAERRQLTGYVRNMSNGSVEMLAQGRAEEVDDCIQDIKEYFSGYIRETIGKVLSNFVANRYLSPKKNIGYQEPVSSSGTNMFDHYFSTLVFYLSNSW